MGTICSAYNSIVPAPSPFPSPLSLQAFTKLRDKGALVIDCREYNDVRAMIIPGSVPIHIQLKYMREMCTALIPKDKKLILVIPHDDPYQGKKETQALRQDGYTVLGCLDGGFGTWVQAGYPIYKRKQLAFKTYSEKDEKPVVVDVQTRAEEDHYDYLRGALHFTWEEVPNRLNEIPKDGPFYVHFNYTDQAFAFYCILLNMGFTNIVGTIEGKIRYQQKRDHSETSDDESEPQGYTPVGHPVLQISPKDIEEAQQIANKVRTSVEDASSAKFQEYKVLRCSTKLRRPPGTRGHLQYDIAIGVGNGKAIEVQVDEELSSTIGPLDLLLTRNPESNSTENTCSHESLKEAQNIADKIKVQAEHFCKTTFKKYKVFSYYTSLYKPTGTRGKVRYEFFIDISGGKTLEAWADEELSSTLGPLKLRSTNLNS